MKLIKLDGTQGEGGGQILRSALALALVTGQGFQMDGIRGQRKKPGLLRQHLTAVEAAGRIGGARVEGASLGSSSLTFVPGTVQPGDYRFAVGTAGSATLVLQTVLPALIRASAPSNLILEGGTHNSMAPPFDFLAQTFLPILNRMGPNVTAKLDTYGFYPAGGGRFRVCIEPCERLRPLALTERGPSISKTGRILVSHLPAEIGRRQSRMLRNKLNWTPDVISLESIRKSPGPGNVVLAVLESEHITEVVTGFGGRGLSSAQVIGEVVDGVRRHLKCEAPVGPHLADQLLLPMALAGAGQFVTGPLSRHSTTNIDVIAKFLPCRFHVTAHDFGHEVSVEC